MTGTEFIEKLKELVSTENILEVSKEVSELRSKFEDYVLEEERKLQVAELEAKDRGETFEAPETDFGKDEFYTIYGAYQEKAKAIRSEKKATEEKNLGEKRSLIKRLEDIVQNEENIGAAFAVFKEVQEKWKEIGDIPRAKRNDIQAEYSKVIEDFFYNIKIYKELKDHDLHRNHQLKSDTIAKLKELSKLDKIKEIEAQLKQLQNDWEDIGPVPNEEWEKLKDAYWTEVRSVYERINRFYEDRRAKLQENLDKKGELLEQAKVMVAGIDELDSIKSWNNATKNLIDVQNNWKAVGFGPKKENDKIWKEFRTVCDTFFDAKAKFFESVHGEYDKLAEKKQKLVDTANELKESTDWKRTANELKKLQNQWRNIGHAGLKYEQKLWKSFRAACDHFFNAREVHFKAQDKEFEVNLKSKEELIEELQKAELPADKKEAIELLKSYSNRFNAIGMVPIKQKDSIYKNFKTALDALYAKLDLKGAEKEEVMFQARIDAMKASPNASRAFQNEKFELRKQIDKHTKEITQLENNLGFFANSKGADKLKQEVEKKIQTEYKKIEALKTRIKLIPNE
jgi:hypothetical protein